MKQISKAGFTAECREDGIWHYHFSDISRATVDAWVEIGNEQDKEALATGEHLLRLTTTAPSIFPTPYTLAKVNEALQNVSPALISEAYIVHNQMAYQLLSNLVLRLQNHDLRAATRIFQKEADAITWLLQRRVEVPSK